MGFTTLMTMYLPVGINKKHQCKTAHILLIVDVTKLSQKRNIYILLIDFNFKDFYRKIRKYGLGSLYL